MLHLSIEGNLASIFLDALENIWEVGHAATENKISFLTGIPESQEHSYWHEDASTQVADSIQILGTELSPSNLALCYYQFFMHLGV